jgi:peptidoglycan/xylan/chitin deacetylase (PgdA/CDA1 family)
MKWTIRNTLAYLYAKSLLLSGVAARSMKQFHTSDNILSIYFHNPSCSLFEKTMKWLIHNKVNFISTEQLNMISQGKLKAPRSPVVITVDDGWKSNKENIIQVAKKFNIPVTIFISTEPVLYQKPFWWSYNKRIHQQGVGYVKSSVLKKWSNKERLAYLNGFGFLNASAAEAMDVSDLIELDKHSNIFFESHTVSHPILTQCSDEEADREIYFSKVQLEIALGRKIKGFAYPNGAYAQREISLLEKYGYEYAFTTRSAFLTPKDLQYRFELPRFEVLDQVSFAENICRIAGVWLRKSKSQL